MLFVRCLSIKLCKIYLKHLFSNFSSIFATLDFLFFHLLEELANVRQRVGY